MCEALLAAGADANLADKQGMTAVHWACEMGRAGAIAVLARAGCDVDARDGKGSTALHSSAAYVQEQDTAGHPDRTPGHPSLRHRS